jgi:excinuclease ABC subunit B
MLKFKLKSPYKPAGDQPKAITLLLEGLRKDYRFQTLLGVTGSGKTFTVANILAKINKPVLVIAPNKSLAAQLYNEYKAFFPENSVNYFVSYYDYYQPEAYLPITDTYIEKEALINEEIDRLRHRATSALMTRRDVIVVASVSCIYNLGVPVNYFGASLYLENGKLITRGDLIRQLIRIQFKRTNLSLSRGYFRIRGDVFEIMPASGEVVYYVEIKDQKIKDLALIDPVEQKIKEKLKELIIFPPKHFVSNEPQRDKAIEEVKNELKERVSYFNKKGLLLEAERLERRTRYDIQMLKSIGYCHGIENYSRHLSGKMTGEPPDTLISYFPYKDGKPDFLTVIDESHIAVPQLGGMYAGDRSRKETLIEYGWRLPSALDNRPLKFEEFLKRVSTVIFTSATPGEFEKKHSKQTVEQIVRPTGIIDPPIEIRPVFDKSSNRSQVDDIIQESGSIIQNKGRVIINTLTKKMSEDLTGFLLKKGFKVNYLHSDVKTLDRVEIIKDFRRGKFDILVGVNLLREGLDLPEVTLVAILDADREGFLRSEVSLIQTMGRTARNVKGKVILYADSITNSMRKAIGEAERRRKAQLEYNKKYGIIPETIRKKIEHFTKAD